MSPRVSVTRLTARWALVMAFGAGAVGCASLHARQVSSADDAWTSTFAAARTLAAAGNFDSADSTLSRFATMYPGTAPALETAYYRALFKMDPSNAHASIPTAMASLDGYLANRRPGQHVVEATTLRRVAAEVDGLTHVATTAVAQARDASNVAKDAKAQAADAKDAASKTTDAPALTSDAEIKRLKDELAKANAELERVRKHLATPPPKQP